MAAVSGAVQRKKAQKPYSAGGAGEISVIEIANLHIDHLYQRDIIADVVEKIAASWDIVTAGTIVVSRRDNGDMFVVDGQHRLAAAQLNGETEILAQIIEGLTAEEEADLRIKGNFKRGDRIYEVFRARVFAGDPVACGIQQLLEGLGTKINYVPDMTHGLNAIAAVEQIYVRDNGATLRYVLHILKDAFGDLDGSHGSSNLLKGVTWFVDRHGAETTRERLVEKIRTQGPGALGRDARNYKAAMGGAMWVNTYRTIVAAYNEGLREQNKLEWRTSRASTNNRTIRGGGGWDD